MPGYIRRDVQIMQQNQANPTWTSIYADNMRVDISDLGLTGPMPSEAREPNAATCRLLMKNDTGMYSIRESGGSSFLIELRNRIRVLARSNLYGKLLRVTTGQNGGNYSQQSTRSITAGQTWTLAWYARASTDIRYNDDNVYIGTSAEAGVAGAYRYTTKWTRYSYTFTPTLSATYIYAFFQPMAQDGTLAGEINSRYVEYKNITLTNPVVNGGNSVLVNGDFATGSASPWVASLTFPPDTITLTVDDDYEIIFNGFIERVSPGPFLNGSRTSVIECTDMITRHARNPVRAPLQQNVRADQAMQTLLSYVPTNPKAAFQAVVQRDGPRRWLFLNEAAGSKTVADSGVEGIAGAVSGGVTFGLPGLLTNGNTDTCARFDGVNGLITQPRLDFAGKNFSIEFLIKPNASPPSVQTVFSINGSGVGSTHLNIAFFIYNDGHVNFSFNNDDLVTGAGVISFGGTYLIELTYDATSNTATIISNGSQVATGTIGPMIGTSPTIQIGALNSAYFYKGDMQHFIIYDYKQAVADASRHNTAAGFDQKKWVTWFPGTQIETGRATFGSAFDGYVSSETAAADGFRDIALSEHGYIWCDRDGTLRFTNREWLARQIFAFSLVANGQNITGPFSIDPPVRDVSRIVNSVLAKYTPRGVAGSPSVIAKLASAELVPGLASGTYRTSGAVPGERQIVMRFVDAAGEPIGGKGIQIPVRGTDWKVNEAPDGTMVDYTTGPLAKYFDLALQSVGPSEVTFLARNWATGALNVYPLQVTGTPITQYNPVLVNKKDQASIDSFGENVLVKEIPFPTAAMDVEAVAAWLLSRYKNPASEINGLQADNTAQIGNLDLIDVEVGDIFNLGDPYAFTDSTKYYHMVIGQEYHLWNDGSTIAFRLCRLESTNFTNYDSGAKYDSGPKYSL